MPSPEVAPSVSMTMEPRTALDRYKRQIHNQFIKTLDGGHLRSLTVDRQRAELQTMLTKVVEIEPPPVARTEYPRVIAELLNDILGFGPLEPLLLDPTVSDILVNGASEVYASNDGEFWS